MNTAEWKKERSIIGFGEKETLHESVSWKSNREGGEDLIPYPSGVDRLNR